MLIEYVGKVPVTSNGILFVPNCKREVSKELGEYLTNTFKDFSEIIEVEVIKPTEEKPAQPKQRVRRKARQAKDEQVKDEQVKDEQPKDEE